MILNDVRLQGTVKSSNIRSWFRKRANAPVILKALDTLHEKGIVSKDEPEGKRGHRCFSVSKRRWSEISSDGGAVEYLKHLRVTRGCFDP